MSLPHHDVRRLHPLLPRQPRFYRLTGKLPACGSRRCGWLRAGLYVGFFVAPTDATQGESHRIIFIHVPAAWMSMVIYRVMAFWAAIGMAFNARLVRDDERAIWRPPAPCSPSSLWDRRPVGQADLGRLVGWDARLTSELILFFLYLGYIALVNAADDDPVGRPGRSLRRAVVGAVNVPIIYFR